MVTLAKLCLVITFGVFSFILPDYIDISSFFDSVEKKAEENSLGCLAWQVLLVLLIALPVYYFFF